MTHIRPEGEKSPKTPGILLRHSPSINSYIPSRKTFEITDPSQRAMGTPPYSCRVVRRLSSVGRLVREVTAFAVERCVGGESGRGVEKAGSVGEAAWGWVG